MSSFMVGDETINNVVSYIRRQEGQYAKTISEAGYNVLDVDLEEDAWVDLAEDMFKLNIQGVDARYGKGEAEKFRNLNFVSQFVTGVTAVQAYKSLSCWLYQCSEGSIPETKFFCQMVELRKELAMDIVEGLPEHDKAIWG